MPSIFSRIVAGEIPCHKIAESEDYFAFLDINPRAEGHTLVIPKQEIDYIFDLEGDHYKGLWAFAQRVAKALEQAVPCERVGIAVIGLEVPHVHIHLIPINRVGDINFERPPLQFSQEAFAATAAKIVAAFK